MCNLSLKPLAGSSQIMTNIIWNPNIFINLYYSYILRFKKTSDIYKEHKFICYKGVIPEQKKLQVSLKFGKVSLDMDSTTLFIQLKSIAEEVFCLSVNESPIEENLIGIPIFQNHNIGFDTVNNKLYIKPGECRKLYDSFKDELGHPDP